MLFQAIILHNLKENQWTNLENYAKPTFGPDFGRLVHIWTPNTFSVGFTSTGHCSNLSFYAIPRKLVNQTWENGEKHNFGLGSPIYEGAINK